MSKKIKVFKLLIGTCDPDSDESDTGDCKDVVLKSEYDKIENENKVLRELVSKTQEFLKKSEYFRKGLSDLNFSLRREINKKNDEINSLAEMVKKSKEENDRLFNAALGGINDDLHQLCKDLESENKEKDIEISALKDLVVLSNSEKKEVEELDQAKNEPQNLLYAALSDEQKEVLRAVVMDFILSVRRMKVVGYMVGDSEASVDFGHYPALDKRFEGLLPTTRTLRFWADAVENIPGLIMENKEVDLKRVLFDLESVFHPVRGVDMYSNYVQDLACKLGVELPPRQEYEQREGYL